MSLKFQDLELKSEILAPLEKLNISNCTEVQEKCMPLVLEGKDISGLSHTGSGKTFAFLVPLIERILRTKSRAPENPTELDQKRAFDDWNSGHFLLVLAPTRELADQIHKNVLLLTENTDLKSVLVYGGVEYEAQTDLLKAGVDIVVGTPGRLIDLYKSHHINFKHIKAVVFDEADRMFDMGFKDDMVYILQRAPKDRQICLFSATLNFDVMNTVYQFGANPVEINISRDQAKVEDVTDEILHVGERDKPQFLLSIILREKPRQTIIFSNYKNNVDRISNFLNLNSVPTVGISSLLTQSQRERVLQQFKLENERNTLVATDVAARGLDIKGVDLVINYDLPDDAENYIHRIGRTGRAGAKGKAFSLVSDRDVPALSRVESYLKNKVTIGWIEDTELVKDFKPMPNDQYRGESRVKKTGLAAVRASTPSQGGRPDPRNRHPRSDRPTQDGDRNERHPRRDRDQRDQRSFEPRRDSAPATGDSSAHGGASHVHRDRKSGRHQAPRVGASAPYRPLPPSDASSNTSSKASSKTSAHAKSTPAQNNHNKFKKNKPFKKQNYDKKQSFRSTKPKDDLGKKIKTFFKSLFK